MSIEFRPAKREAVSLLIGLAGASGSGKTFSALELARGLAGDRTFALIDTEAGRALHYADRFAFDHAALDPPFRPDRYLEAIAAADKAGYPVVIVDSASHEHAGDGGLLDWHDAELDRMAGDDWAKRERVKMAAWIAPKQAHKRFVSRLLQMRAHVILCFRAEEKIEIARGQDGRTEIRPKRTLTGLDGWVPVCEKTLPFELTLSLLLTPDAPGVPRAIKLQEQHRPMVPLDRPLDAAAGAALAAWAAGDPAAGPAPAGTARDDAAAARRRIRARQIELGLDDDALKKALQAATGKPTASGLAAELEAAVIAELDKIAAAAAQSAPAADGGEQSTMFPVPEAARGGAYNEGGNR